MCLCVCGCVYLCVSLWQVFQLCSYPLLLPADGLCYYLPFARTASYTSSELFGREQQSLRAGVCAGQYPSVWWHQMAPGGAISPGSP